MFLRTYHKLLKDFGARNWWPAKTKFEVMAGAILVQNTAWTNASKALAELRSRKLLTPRNLDALSAEEIAPLIRSSGYFNDKARKLKAVLAWYARYGYSAARVRRAFSGNADALRAELLEIRGVGPETADSFLCYAFDLPFFVVDAYTFRWLERYDPRRRADLGKYELLRVAVEREFRRRYSGAELTRHLGEYHAQIVRLGAQVCRKREPRCGECPVKGTCAYNNQTIVA